MLLAKEGKQRSLRVLGRWRKLVTAWQRSDQQYVKVKKLRINAKWRLLAVKALQKDKKLTSLRATGNWLKLYLALKRYEHEIYKERRNRKLAIHAQWAKMARGLLVRTNKTRTLTVMGRWRVLCAGLKKIELTRVRQRRLRAHAALGRMARKLVLRDNKVQSLRVIGRWRTLYVGLKTAEYSPYRELKEKKLQITARWRVLATRLLQRGRTKTRQRTMEVNAAWRRLARKALNKHYRLSSLGNAGKWARLSRILLVRDENQRSARVLQRWQLLVKGLAREPDN